MQYLKPGEEVFVKDLSAELVKVDVQGPYSYKVITEIFGKDCVKNRTNPEKNMGYFNFNEVTIEGETYFFSRTGYTNRWGWEIYIPVKQAVDKFKQIVLKAMEYGGLLVGLGGRDENRISAGNVGLPLMGHEYDDQHTPTNAPLFNAAIAMNKESFIGKDALLKDITDKVEKRMVLIIAEGNIVNNGVYLNGKRLGSVTSCIISPNVPHEKRLYIGSERRNVNEENGTAAIALAWIKCNPYLLPQAKCIGIGDGDGDIIRLKVELFREKDGQPIGKPVLGYISSDGVNPATAPKALKSIENL
jgi:aminomethyltransferase